MYCARDLACAVLFSKNLHHSTVVFFDKKNPFLEVFFHTTVVIEVFYHTTVVFFFFAKRQIGTQRRAGDWPRLSIHVRGTFLKKKKPGTQRKAGDFAADWPRLSIHVRGTKKIKK